MPSFRWVEGSNTGQFHNRRVVTMLADSAAIQRLQPFHDQGKDALLAPSLP